MPVWSKANMAKDGRRPFRRECMTPAIQDVDDRHAQRPDDPETWPAVIGEEVGGVVGQCETLLLWFIRSAEEDEAVAAVGIQATHQVATIGRKYRMAVVTPQPLAYRRDSDQRELHHRHGKLQ